MLFGEHSCLTGTGKGSSAGWLRGIRGTEPKAARPNAGPALNSWAVKLGIQRLTQAESVRKGSEVCAQKMAEFVSVSGPPMM